MEERKDIKGHILGFYEELLGEKEMEGKDLFVPWEGVVVCS